MTSTFDPADPESWTSRGRPTDHAIALAEAWQAFPDLPPEAPLEARMARTRERVAAMKPVNDAIAAEARRLHVARNFAFVEMRIATGDGDLRYPAILRARDIYSFCWDEAVAYADGWYAARAGWEPRPHAYGATRAAQIAAYDRGFRDGGGDPDDLFDTARRAFSASTDAPETTRALPQPSRPAPANWPSPTDRPRPVRWSKRLLLIADPHGSKHARALFEDLSRRPGHEDACVIVIGDRGFVRPDAPANEPCPSILPLLEGRAFEDILLVADQIDMSVIDRLAGTLPLARTMERTRNSTLQQRAQFRLWLDRGLEADVARAAGHIRWSKVAQGLRGRLGEFTARHAGPARPRGHRIVVELSDGSLATGYATAQGRRLSPELVISNRRNLRREISTLLRDFAAALRFPANERSCPDEEGAISGAQHQPHPQHDCTAPPRLGRASTSGTAGGRGVDPLWLVPADDRAGTRSSAPDS